MQKSNGRWIKLPKMRPAGIALASITDTVTGHMEKMPDETNLVAAGPAVIASALMKDYTRPQRSERIR
jgi:hypothetical protein